MPSIRKPDKYTFTPFKNTKNETTDRTVIIDANVYNLVSIFICIILSVRYNAKVVIIKNETNVAIAAPEMPK